MLRQFLHHVRPRLGHVSRYASRYHRAFRYGLDLVLWSRLLNKRRNPIPLDLPHRLLIHKGITHQPPVLFIADPTGHYQHWEEGFQAIYANLFLNLQTPDVISAWRYAHPAPSFHGIYLWDTAFISQIWKHWDHQVALEINRAVIDQQCEGRLPHVVATFTESKHTQPPVLAWSIMRDLEWTQREQIADIVSEVYPPLAEYNRWLYQNRQLENGLFFWEHPYESGIDNSPRFSNRDESHFRDTSRMASPDVSSYLVLQNETLADLAKMIGDERARQTYLNQADRLREKINDLLWEENHGLYYDLDIDRQQHITRSTIASLIPLWAGVPDQSRAVRLLETIMDTRRYNTLVPLPTVGLEDDQFVKDMWCGPVWINTAYMVLQGLERYGFLTEQAELVYKLCEGVFQTYHNTLKFHEFYDPERYDLQELSRKQGNRFKHMTLGSKPVVDFVGWTGLVNPLIIEVLIGVRRTMSATLLMPNMPEQTIGRNFQLRLPDMGCIVSVDHLAMDEYECTYRDIRAVHRTHLTRGQVWDLSTFEVGTRESHTLHK